MNLVCMIALVGKLSYSGPYREIAINANKLEQFYYYENNDNLYCPAKHTYIPNVGCFNIKTSELAKLINDKCRSK